MEIFSTVKVVLRESQLSLLLLLLVQCSDAVAVAQRLDMGIIRIHKLENTNQNCNEVTQIL
jgi:predicted regulator of amino acid metabolism with ACT domain